MKKRILGRWLAFCLAWVATGLMWAGDEEEMVGKEKAYLGVYVEGVSSVLSSQLGLDDGVGVVVEGVIDGGPAQKAGLKKNDILLRFDDQILIGTKQIVVLVRNSEIGSEHAITLLRGGKETVIEVTIEAKKGSSKKAEEHSQFFHMENMPGFPDAPLPPDARMMALKALVGEEQDGEDAFFFSHDGDIDVDVTRRMEWNEEIETLMERVQEVRHSQAPPEPPVVFHGEDHVFEFLDDAGNRFIIVDKDGGRKLTILNSDGSEEYDGALTDEAEGLLPQSVKVNLPKIQKLVRVKVDAPAWPQKRSEESF